MLNSQTVILNFVITPSHHHGRGQGGTWAMVTISHFHTLPPTILQTL